MTRFIKVKADEHRSPFPKGHTYISLDDIARVSGIVDDLVGPEFSIFFKQGGRVNLLGRKLHGKVSEFIESNCDVEVVE